MEKEVKSKNIYQRLNAIQRDVTSVFKNKAIGYGNFAYKVVQHDDVTAAIRPAMVEHGVFVEVTKESTTIETVEVKRKNGDLAKEYLATVVVVLTFVNVDDPQDRYSVKSSAIGFDSSDKCVGKACSMAVKNAYLKNLMLESKDEEEERGFEERNKMQGQGQRQHQNKQNSPQNNSPQNNSQAGPSEKQIGMIRSLVKAVNSPMKDEQIKLIKTSRDASAIIAKLQTRQRELKEAKPDNAPQNNNTTQIGQSNASQERPRNTNPNAGRGPGNVSFNLNDQR